MGGVNSIPVVSQVKSAVLAVTGHCDEARNVQEEFSKGCPVVSQVRSAVEAISGDEKAALETQRTFAGGVADMAGGLPGVGLVLAAVELTRGNKEKAEAYLESSYRTSAVICGSVVGGPLGAVAGGMAMDALQTGIASLVHKDYHPTGLIAGVTESIRTGDPGVVFDTAITPGLDYFMSKPLNAARLKSAIIAQKEAPWVKFNKDTGDLRAKLEAPQKYSEAELHRIICKTVKIGGQLQDNVKQLGLDVIAKGDEHVVCSFMVDKNGRSGAGFNKFVRSALDKKDPQLVAKAWAQKNRDLRSGPNMQKWQKVAKNKLKSEDPEKVEAKVEAIIEEKLKVVFNFPDYFEEMRSSQLQQDFPAVAVPLARLPHLCAEHEAYEWLSRQSRKSGGIPEPEETYTFKVDEAGKVTSFTRCANCIQYNVMGRVPTDDLHGVGIPRLEIPDHAPFLPSERRELIQQRRSLRGKAGALTVADALGDRYMDHKKRLEAIKAHAEALAKCEDCLNNRGDSPQKAALLSEVHATKASLLALLSQHEEAIESFEKASQLATKGNDTWVHAQYGKAFCLQLASKDEEAIEIWSQLLTERIDQVESGKEPHLTMMDASIAHHLGMLLLRSKKDHAAAGVLLATSQRLMKLYADEESTRLIFTPHAMRVYKDDEVRVFEGTLPVMSILIPDNVLTVTKIQLWFEGRNHAPTPSTLSLGFGKINILNHSNELVDFHCVSMENDTTNDQWTRISMSLTNPHFLAAIQPGFSLQFVTSNTTTGCSRCVRNCDITVEFVTMEDSLSFFDYFLQVESNENQEHTISEGTLDIATIDFSRIPKDKYFKACTSIYLRCESHDEGWSGVDNDQGSSRNSWSCGKIAVINQNGEIVADRIVYRNRIAVEEYQQHTTVIDDVAFLSSINPQMKVVFQIQAQAQSPIGKVYVRNFDFGLHCVGF